MAFPVHTLMFNPCGGRKQSRREILVYFIYFFNECGLCLPEQEVGGRERGPPLLGLSGVMSRAVLAGRSAALGWLPSRTHIATRALTSMLVHFGDGTSSARERPPTRGHTYTHTHAHIQPPFSTAPVGRLVPLPPLLHTLWSVLLQLV